MAAVEVEVNGHAYTIACNDGEEAQIMALAAQVDAKLQDVVSMVGQIGDQRLLLMSAILIADDMSAQKKRLATADQTIGKLEERIHQITEQLDQVEGSAADKLEAAAQRVENVLSTLPAHAAPETAPPRSTD